MKPKIIVGGVPDDIVVETRRIVDVVRKLRSKADVAIFIAHL